jgi:uncharacterized protein (TIGR00725 family)
MANPYVDVAIATGLGEARNAIVGRAAQVVVAIGGSYGTLSEIAFALKQGRPVVGLNTWKLACPDGETSTGVIYVNDALEAARRALALARGASRTGGCNLLPENPALPTEP